MNELVKSLVKAKASFGAIKKDKRNPAFKTSYASLDAILAAVDPSLCANGLVVIQTFEAGEAPVLVSRLIHESGEVIESRYPLPVIGDPQKFGAAITYARRYSICALLGVTADEDDDGAAAVPSSEQVRRQALDADLVKLVKQLGWDANGSEQAKAWIKAQYGVNTRAQLTEDQLRDAVSELSKTLAKTNK